MDIKNFHLPYQKLPSCFLVSARIVFILEFLYMLYFKKGTFIVKHFESQHSTSNFLHCKIDPLAIFHIYLVHFSTS